MDGGGGGGGGRCGGLGVEWVWRRVGSGEKWVGGVEWVCVDVVIDVGGFGVVVVVVVVSVDVNGSIQLTDASKWSSHATLERTHGSNCTESHSHSISRTSSEKQRSTWA